MLWHRWWASKKIVSWGDWRGCLGERHWKTGGYTVARQDRERRKAREDWQKWESTEGASPDARLNWLCGPIAWTRADGKEWAHLQAVQHFILLWWGRLSISLLLTSVSFILLAELLAKKQPLKTSEVYSDDEEEEEDDKSSEKSDRSSRSSSSDEEEEWVLMYLY